MPTPFYFKIKILFNPCWHFNYYVNKCNNLHLIFLWKYFVETNFQTLNIKFPNYFFNITFTEPSKTPKVNYVVFNRIRPR